MRMYIYNTPDMQGFPLVATGLEIKVLLNWLVKARDYKKNLAKYW